jgi:hypothetical protein
MSEDRGRPTECRIADVQRVDQAKWPNLLTSHAEKTPDPQGTHSSRPTPGFNGRFSFSGAQRRDRISYALLRKFARIWYLCPSAVTTAFTTASENMTGRPPDSAIIRRSTIH